MNKPRIATPGLGLMLVACAAAPLAGVQPAAAQAAKTIDVPALQTIIAGLGLEDIGDKSTYVAVGGQGGPEGNGYVIDFSPSADKSYVAVYMRWTGVPKDKLPMMPALKMLEYNNTHDFMFSIGADKDEGKAIVMEHDFSAQAVTPQVMRKAIDDLVAAADETVDLRDPGKWTTPDQARAAR